MPLVSINPATGRILKRHREHTAKDIEAALAATHQAFLGWRELALADRARHLNALGAALRKQAEPLAQLITAEMGKTLTDARLEIEKCAAGCEFYATHAARFLKPQRTLGAPKNTQVVFEPLGVILAIMPWNYPFWQLFRAAAPALMAGNTVLLKHASNTTGCALAIEHLFRDARVPANLLRTVAVSSKAIPALIKDPRVRGVTLTGSTGAGRKVGALAGAALKPCVFELGGSDPYIILADADLDLAAEICAKARLTNSGQSCVAAKRFIVVESVRAAFEQKFTARMAARRMGDPTTAATDFGPLARLDLRDDLHAQVQKSVKRGARLLLGGTIQPKGKGAFYPATVLTDVRPGMPAYDEELFGPVASIIAAKDEADALRIANDSDFGLGAAVFTRNRRHGRTLAIERIEAGMVFVNEQVRSDASLPFGGIKDSGYGRELSTFGIREFVNIKTIWVS
ncbi:NAD-dependent succinate-semialdehyde dehydrogenase [Rariglobus hedericola]|uniref:NAD-dependent succinate-semialdehyde dehydrogenase n=1 Tax=Rariglobus hedericola TaxID=2597822 RepID=A0A556QL35_9BACT|nr:NAD-dependent succinate-semialdehyde dehydrogenase [Rariglobus hedericola]TSJ77356.1 NAD-dependent succinate-semialdehyde dehydrogenase [Rariglobus hedericola]